MLTLALLGVIASLVLINLCLVGATWTVLGREQALIVKVERLENETNGLQDQSNERAGKLSRRRQPSLPGRTPSVPPQRKAS